MKLWLLHAALCTTKNLILLGTVGALIIYPLYVLLFFRNFAFEWKIPCCSRFSS